VDIPRASGGVRGPGENAQHVGIEKHGRRVHTGRGGHSGRDVFDRHRDRLQKTPRAETESIATGAQLRANVESHCSGSLRKGRTGPAVLRFTFVPEDSGPLLACIYIRSRGGVRGDSDFKNLTKNISYAYYLL